MDFSGPSWVAPLESSRKQSSSDALPVVAEPGCCAEEGTLYLRSTSVSISISAAVVGAVVVVGWGLNSFFRYAVRAAEGSVLKADKSQGRCLARSCAVAAVLVAVVVLAVVVNAGQCKVLQLALPDSGLVVAEAAWVHSFARSTSSPVRDKQAQH